MFTAATTNMRNLTGSTKYAPVGSNGEDLNNEVNEIKNAPKSTILTGQVRKQYDKLCIYIY